MQFQVNVDVIPFPKQAAADSSVLDNSMFAAWRTLYRKVRAGSRNGKFRCAVIAWLMLKPQSIRNCWAACLDVDRTAYYTIRWKAKKAQLRAELLQNADREVNLPLGDLQGEEEGDIYAEDENEGDVEEEDDSEAVGEHEGEENVDVKKGKGNRKGKEKGRRSKKEKGKGKGRGCA